MKKNIILFASMFAMMSTAAWADELITENKIISEINNFISDTDSNKEKAQTMINRLATFLKNTDVKEQMNNSNREISDHATSINYTYTEIIRSCAPSLYNKELCKTHMAAILAPLNAYKSNPGFKLIASTKLEIESQAMARLAAADKALKEPSGIRTQQPATRNRAQWPIKTVSPEVAANAAARVTGVGKKK